MLKVEEYKDNHSNKTKLNESKKNNHHKKQMSNGIYQDNKPTKPQQIILNYSDDHDSDFKDGEKPYKKKQMLDHF